MRINAETDEAEGNLGSLGDMFGGLGGIVAGFAATAVAALGTFAVAMGVKAFNAAEDLQKGLNDLQAQTGASDKEMKGYEQSIKNLYSQNFGESMSDIASKMAEVKKQTGLSGKTLEDFTKNAMILADTFGYDVNESTRSAQALMSQFGITGDEAFNLIAQGAQKGLDKNGDLLDTINEYSVQFKSLGFDSDQMFDTLAASAESGAWSIDKIGDSVKEFNIRAKDGSKTSAEGFKALGLDAKKMTATFAKGGEDANKAFYQVIDALGAMKDPVKQNAAGVALFGTQFEDLEADGILALGNIEDGFNRAKNTMDGINNVKYNTFSKAMSGIGRQLEVGILVPLGQMVLPLLNKFAGVLNQYLPPALSLFKQIGSYIMGVFGPVFKQAFFGIMNNLKGFMSGSSETKSQVQPIFEAIKQLAVTLAKYWQTYFGFIINTVLPPFLSIVKTLLPVIGTVIYAVIKILTFIFQRWTLGFKMMGAIIGPLFNHIATTIGLAMGIIKDIITVITGLIQGDWNKVFAGIRGITAKIWAGIQSMIKMGMNIIKNVIRVGLNASKGTFSRILKAIPGIIKGAFRLGVNAAKLQFKLMLVAIKAVGSGIKTAIRAVVSYVGNKLKSLGKSAYKWGKNFLSSFANGVKSKINYLKNMARNAANSIKSFLGFSSPTEEGPGKTAHKWAPNMMTMFAKGIKANISDVRTASYRAADSMRTGFLDSRIPKGLGGSSGTGDVIITGNSIVNEQLVNKIMQQAIRKIKNRGR